MLIRDASAGDFEHILRLNEESVHFLSPLSPEGLELLHSQAAYHRVVEQSGEIAAFLMAFREGSLYDGLCYRWFVERFEQFLYVDRVVVSKACQGQGIGSLLYDDIFEFARITDASCVTCEFDIEPANDISRRFHARYGFEEVGQQYVKSDTKRVSLQLATLEATTKS